MKTTKRNKDMEYMENELRRILTYKFPYKDFILPFMILVLSMGLLIGGGYAKIVNDAVKELEAILVGEKQKNGSSQGKLKERIKSLLGIHEATEQEIEQVYNHILMEMLK